MKDNGKEIDRNEAVRMLARKCGPPRSWPKDMKSLTESIMARIWNVDIECGLFSEEAKLDCTKLLSKTQTAMEKFV